MIIFDVDSRSNCAYNLRRDAVTIAIYNIFILAIRKNIVGSVRQQTSK